MKKYTHTFSLFLALASLFSFTAESEAQEWTPLKRLDKLTAVSSEEPFTYYSLAANPGIAAVLNSGSTDVDAFRFAPDLGWNTPTKGWRKTVIKPKPQLYTKIAVLPPILSAPEIAVGVVQKKGGGIFSTTLFNGEWSSTQTITSDKDAEFPSIALNCNAYIIQQILPLGISVWNQSTPNRPIFYSIYFQGSDPFFNWSEPAKIPGSKGKFANVATDSNGHAAAVWVNPSTNTIDAATYIIDSSPDFGVWSSITRVGSSNITYPRLQVDAAGNAVALWIDADNKVAASVHPLRGEWSKPSILSSTSSNSNPSLAVDPVGNAVAVWQDGSNTIYGATLPFEGSWSSAQQLSETGEGFVPEVSVDTLGNAIAVWFDTAPNIQYALLPVDGSWGQATPLPTTKPGSNYPKVGSDGDSAAVVVCQDTANGFLVATSVTDLFPPVAPYDFKGKNTDNGCTHSLSWKPSQDTSIVNYRLFRNGQRIAKIPFDGPYVYDDTDRCNESDVYTLVAVNSSGVESAPLTVRVK